MAGFVATESYLHRAAKETVAGWLRDAYAETEAGGWFDLPPLYGRPNRSAPHFGIWLEYPFCDDGAGHCPTWDETPYAKEWGDGTVPTYDRLVADGRRVACVCDIAICHKGIIHDVVEIVHKHPTPQAKRDFLGRQGIRLTEVDAYRVLSQIGTPASLPLWEPPRRKRKAAA